MKFLFVLIAISLSCQASFAKLSDKTVYYYAFDGENLQVSYTDLDSIETIYWFKKCMANQLYTFFRVGYREKEQNGTKENNYFNDAKTCIINATSSDNIGPFAMYPGGWVGGNHHYPNETAQMLYNTAKCDSFRIYIDGKKLTKSSDGIANKIFIKVYNTIFDPTFPPIVGNTHLSVPMCNENVCYIIHQNTIEVDATHHFLSDVGMEGHETSISAYYGMQSMFENEEYFMTPNGQYTDWASATEISATTFKKKDFPYFNRYIEKSVTRGTYQAAYMNPVVGLGNHEMVADEEFIFNRSYGKCYHRLISAPFLKPLAGITTHWNGSYTFFHRPIADDENIFIYRGFIGNNEALFVNTKEAFNGVIPMPRNLRKRKYSVIEARGLTASFSRHSLSVKSNGAASLIIKFEE